MRSGRRLGTQDIPEKLNLDSEAVRKALIEDVNMRKIFAKTVPEILIDEQKH